MKMRSFRPFTVAAAAVLLCVTLAAAAQEKKPTVKVVETSLGKVLAGKNAVRLHFSPDGLHVAYAVNQVNDWKVVLDGKVVKSHDWVAANSLAISDTGGHVAYTVQEKDGSMRVVVDGVEQKPYAEVSPPVLSPDGKRHIYWARAAKDAKGQIVVVDGVPSAEFEKVGTKSLKFSPDGKRFSFAAQRDGKWLIVVDWKEGKPYDEVGALEFGKDGARFGHKGERGGKAVAVIDGEEQKEHDKVGGFAFSDDGKHVAYAAATGKRYYIVADGKVLGDQPDAPGGAIDDDANPQMISEPVYSPDGRRLAYVTVRKRLFTVVVDGKPLEAHDVAGDVQFSADSKHVVYRARDERVWRVVVDGKPGKPYDATGPAIVSPDGSRVAYAAQQGVETFLVLNEAELPGDLNVSLSPSGKHVAHAMEPKELARRNTNALLINGHEVHTVKGFLKGSKFVWDGDRKFHAMSGRELEIFRLEVTIEE